MRTIAAFLFVAAALVSVQARKQDFQVVSTNFEGEKAEDGSIVAGA